MNGWFANISVNLKLGLGFGLVLLLTGLLALTGWTSLGSLIDRSNWMSDITKLNSDLTNLRVARLQYMLTNGDDTSAANVLDKLDAFGAQQQHLVNTFKSPENLKLLREQGETIAKYRVSLEKMRKAYKTGLAAREALNQNARQASEALAAIEAVSRDALARTSGDTATLQQFLAISQAKEQLVQLRRTCAAISRTSPAMPNRPSPVRLKNLGGDRQPQAPPAWGDRPNPGVRVGHERLPRCTASVPRCQRRSRRGPCGNDRRRRRYRQTQRPAVPDPTGPSRQRKRPGPQPADHRHLAGPAGRRAGSIPHHPPDHPPLRETLDVVEKSPMAI